VASRQTTDQVERQARSHPTRPLGIEADHCRFVEEHTPGRLHGCIRERSVALVRQPAQLFEETLSRLTTELSVCQSSAISLHSVCAITDAWWSRPTRSGFSEQIARPSTATVTALGGRSMITLHEPLAIKKMVSPAPLIDDRAAGRDHDLPHTARQLPDLLSGRVKKTGACSRRRPAEHGVERRPAAVGLLTGAGERSSTPLAVQHRRRILGANPTRARGRAPVLIAPPPCMLECSLALRERPSRIHRCRPTTPACWLMADESGETGFES